MVQLVDFAVLEDAGHLKDLILEREEKERSQRTGMVTCSCLDDVRIVERAKEFAVGTDLPLADERTANGTGSWIRDAEFQQPLNALIAEEVVIRACQHGPFAEYVVQFIAYVALRGG